MIYIGLPKIDGARPVSSLPWGRETIVVHDKSNEATYGRHTAPFSIKTVRAGSEHYETHGFFEKVGPNDYLVLNDDQQYQSAITDDDGITETQCVFFSKKMVAESLVQTSDLENARADGRCIELAGVKRVMPDGLRSLMNALPALCREGPLAAESAIVRILQRIFEIEAPHIGRADDLSALRSATRRELLRRCEIGRAYLRANVANEVTLEEVAAIAKLSSTHFLRAYKQCFGVTPIVDLRNYRIDYAARLIEQRAANVSEAALAAGYRDFSAFSRAFRRRRKIAPSSLVR